MPVVAATRLKRHVDRAAVFCIKGSNETLARKILRKGIVGQPDRVGTVFHAYQIAVGQVCGIDGAFKMLLQRGCQPMGLFFAHIGGQHVGHFTELCFAYSHLEGAANMGQALRSHPRESAKGSYGGKFALCKRQIVARKDIAEEVGFQIVVGGRGIGIVEGNTAAQLGLHFRSFDECVVTVRKRVGVAPFIERLPVLSVLGLDGLEQVERIKAARKAGISIELAENFLYLGHTKAVGKSALDGSVQLRQVSFSLKAGDDHYTALGRGKRHFCLGFK